MEDEQGKISVEIIGPYVLQPILWFALFDLAFSSSSIYAVVAKVVLSLTLTVMIIALLSSGEVRANRHRLNHTPDGRQS